MLQFIKRLFGPGSKRKIKAPRFRAELEAHLDDAERALGIKYRGPTIRVRLEEGDRLSNDRPWKGKRDHRWQGVATGWYSNPPPTVTLYTTNGEFRPATATHEMAHAVLNHAGVPNKVHHAQMREAGIS